MSKTDNSNHVSVAAALDLVDELNTVNLEYKEVRLQQLLKKFSTLDLIDRLPIADYFYLWDVIRKNHTIPEIGLTLGQKINPSSKGVLASWVSQTSSLAEAVDTFIENTSLMNTAEQWQVDMNGFTCTLKLTIHKCDDYPTIAVERSMSAMVAWANLLSGNKVKISRANFTFDAPDYKSKLVPIFGKNIIFSSDVNSLEFPSTLLEEPIQTSSMFLKSIAEQKAKEVLVTIRGSSIIKDKTKALVVDCLNNGQTPSINVIAKQQHMSRQTLYRRLKEEGSNFKKIVDQVRSERVRSLISSGQHSITELCFGLGFKEPSSFYKAFKRWFGVTPAQYIND
ncbi:AraC family transcriptional regulator [Vibrio pacinii]|uniref:AraC family transcriptional regulator n=1 Tax=Vibrio pacinii TaxID=170674 RepID=UPI00056E2104|nr:helix-turn-helix domain-containing protein [Vibrio pacinii]